MNAELQLENTRDILQEKLIVAELIFIRTFIYHFYT